MARPLAHTEGGVDPLAVRLVRRTVPLALRDALNAARKVAIDRGVPEIAAAFDRESYFDDAGSRRALPQNSPGYTAWKVAKGFDKRRGHKTGALQKGMADKRAVRRETTKPARANSTPGGQFATLSFKYLQPLLRKIAHIADYRANKAQVGQPSFSAQKRMADAAAKAYAERMNSALRAEGFRERVRLTKNGEVSAK